jgi:hypothetical protein
MAPQRPNIFDEASELDVSSFGPKPAPDLAAPPIDQVRAVTAAANFQSREPAATPTPRQARRYRTGRTAQFNVRTTPATVDAFYAIADRKGWKVGETLERALAALERELAGS